MTLTEHLQSLNACQDGLDFAAGKTGDQLWTTIERPDWLGWWLAKTNTEPENRRLIQFYCRIWSCDITPLLLEIEHRPFSRIVETCLLWAIDQKEETREHIINLSSQLSKTSAAKTEDQQYISTFSRRISFDFDVNFYRARAIENAMSSELPLFRSSAVAMALDRAITITLVILNRNNCSIGSNATSAICQHLCDEIRAEFRCPLKESE